MADLPSQALRDAISTSAAPYHVRVDVPVALDDPKTRVFESSQSNAAGCALFVATTLADTAEVAEELRNVQVRIWFAPAVAVDAHLVFDRTTHASDFAGVLADFVNEPRQSGLAGLGEHAIEVRRQLGGPFDSDHALMVATNRHVAGQSPPAPGE